MDDPSPLHSQAPIPSAGSSNSPRILHLVTDLRLGGTQSMLLERVRRPGPFRHEVLVFAHRTGIASDPAFPPPPDLTAEFAAAGTPVYSLDLASPKQVLFAWLDRSLVARLRAPFRRSRPALIHSTLFHTHLLGEHLRHLWGVPHVASKEGLDLWMLPWHRILESVALRRADRVVAVSGSVAQRVLALGVRNERLRTIPNGIDLDRPGTWQIPADAGAPPGERIVAVGRCDPAKGWEDLLRGMQEVVRRRPRVRLDLLVSGTEEERGRLLALARRLGISDSIRLADPTRRGSEGLESAGRVDPPPVLVVPSREEGFGLVILEGMARGLPIVATQVGGIPELVRDGLEAILVPPRDPRALARGILRLLDDPALAAALALAGRVRVRAFPVEEMVRRYHGLYREVLGP